MYLSLNKQIITDFSEQNINELYSRGFLFTREGKGAMYETRSVRVDLNKFELSSENRRILRKTENLKMDSATIPYKNYSWEIGKFAKDFYETKFGKGIFSANKIKELLTAEEKSNFNLLLKYSTNNIPNGYTICYENKDILHYCYPFYDLKSDVLNLGIGMMTKAIVWAKENNKKFVYLGSVKDSAGLYKFQFKGTQWWDGKKWNEDEKELKSIFK